MSGLRILPPLSRLAVLPALALVFMLSSAPSLAGGYRLEPGAATRIDTGERQTYTTITITNRDPVPGRLALDAPIDRSVEVPAGGEVELYGVYSTGTVGVTNTGPSRLEVVTRYLERPRLP